MAIIKKEYINQYKEVHARNRGYGTSANWMLPLVQLFIDDVSPKSIIDYGCGKSRLSNDVNGDFVRAKYDPSIDEYSVHPEGDFDFLMNTDVLEHIPEEDIPDVIRDMASLSKVAYISISTRLATAILPNGENAHCTVYPASWWKEKLEVEFDIVIEIESLYTDSATFVTWNVHQKLKEENSRIIKKIKRDIFIDKCKPKFIKRKLKGISYYKLKQRIKNIPFIGEMIYKLYKRIK